MADRHVGHDVARERAELRATLAAVGPDAPSGCGTWSATDLAVHVAIGEVFGGMTTAPFRLLVARGVRLDRMAGASRIAHRRYRRRHDFDWAMRRLGGESPRLLAAGPVAAVTLLEVWAHHEDVLAANESERCESGADLAPVLRVLARYQRRFLARHAIRVTSGRTVWHQPTSATRIEVSGELPAVARWLAGRGTSESLEMSGEAGALEAARADELRI